MEERDQLAINKEIKSWIKMQEDFPKYYVKYLLEDGTTFRSMGFSPRCGMKDGDLMRVTSRDVALGMLRETWKADAAHIDLPDGTIRSIRVDNIKEMQVVQEE